MRSRFRSKSAKVRYTRLEGGCMRPLLRTGDVVPVRRIPPWRIRPGDIALYRSEGKQYLHRVWWRRGGMLWIKDDAALVGLHRVQAERIKGVLDDGGLFRRGWSGLLFSLASNGVFLLGRLLKGSGGGGPRRGRCLAGTGR